MSMKHEIDEIIDTVKDHHEFFKHSLPMIASENITSRTVRVLLSSDLSHRYAEGTVGHRYYQGCDHIDLIEGKAIEHAKTLFKAEHVNVQPISGVNANIAAFFALTDPEDKIISLSVPHGGHISHARYSAAGIRKLRVDIHPFDSKEMNIDPDKMVKKIRELEPKVIVFGASLFLFPHPVREAREVADEVGAKIVYDAAHVLGLIAGKQFQDPLREGADVVTGSTHKTFPGPQGAIILSKSDIGHKIDHAVFPGTVSNHHLHHIAGLAVSLVEMLEFGEDYAKQTISNAKALAQRLNELGLHVLCEEKGFTQTHQVALDVSDHGSGSLIAINLERANIVANKNLLPWDDVNYSDYPSGLRLGTQELTRLGMRESEMVEVADLIKRVIVDKDIEKVKSDIINLRRDYQKVHYCFDGEGAYEFNQ
ncbi:MAG: serine hydroxymethyltransferase [Halobacteriota archaeon]|nr:serine hydroxymethyltransferase [Halobacteriota archaeon]